MMYWLGIYFATTGLRLLEPGVLPIAAWLAKAWRFGR